MDTRDFEHVNDDFDIDRDPNDTSSDELERDRIKFNYKAAKANAKAKAKVAEAYADAQKTNAKQMTKRQKITMKKIAIVVLLLKIMEDHNDKTLTKEDVNQATKYEKALSKQGISAQDINAANSLIGQTKQQLNGLLNQLMGMI